MAGVRTTLLAKLIKDSNSVPKSLINTVINVQSKRTLANLSRTRLVKGKSDHVLIKYTSKYSILVVYMNY